MGALSPTWEPGEIDVAGRQPDDFARVKGYINGPFGIFDQTQIDQAGYSLTHIRTGLVLARTELMQDAIALANVFDRAYDAWSSVGANFRTTLAGKETLLRLSKLFAKEGWEYDIRNFLCRTQAISESKQ